MLASEYNPTVLKDGQIIGDIVRYRSYYLALDLDLDKIKTRSKFLKTTFFVLNFIKFPLPTVEFNSLGETKFYPFFF